MARRIRSSRSVLRRIVMSELDSAERIFAVTGDAGHLASARELSRALAAYQDSDARVYRAAMDIGITDDAWQAIKTG